MLWCPNCRPAATDGHSDSCPGVVSWAGGQVRMREYGDCYVQRAPRTTGMIALACVARIRGRARVFWYRPDPEVTIIPHV